MGAHEDMSIYDGVVTLDDNQIEVILGVEENTVRLSAGGVEIGEWTSDECSISPAGDGSFNITAEDEVLVFVPRDISSFTAAVGTEESSADRERRQEENGTREPRHMAPGSLLQIEEAPEPRVATLVGFYTLVLVTAALGAWALFSLF